FARVWHRFENYVQDELQEKLGELEEKLTNEEAKEGAKQEEEKEAGDKGIDRDECYRVYLEQTAYCGETYTDDRLYEICMDNAWKNYIRCLNGLPPKPLVPR